MKYRHLASILVIFVVMATTITPAAANAPRAVAALPRPLDTLVDVQMGEPETLDPALDYETLGMRVIPQVYEPLLALPKGGQTGYIPQLAYRWETSADGLTYTFYIRGGITFHNGAMLTAEDVAYSFRRGILQGGSYSPQWLLTQPLFGPNISDISLLVDPSGNLMDNRNALQGASSTARTAACRAVEKAVAFNNTARTVTFHLKQPWGPFLDTLTGPWGSVMNKAWVTANGGWNGNCATWQNYYAQSAAKDPFSTIANGTGPYRLDHWTLGMGLVLTSYPSYWRQTPAFPNGPVGEAKIKQVTLVPVSDPPTRLDMLLNGQADIANIAGADRPAAEAQLFMHYTDYGTQGRLVNSTGKINMYEGVQASSTNYGLFTYDIRDKGQGRKYTGSGKLDGKGIPNTFFQDIHVRKAFNYAFDWTQFITDNYNGQADQLRGPIPNGILGYRDTQPMYSKDLALAAQELALAYSGDVAAKGFYMQVAYNTGNTARKSFLEILQQNLAAINSKYQIEIIELPYADYQDDLNRSALPIYMANWLADYPNPHNFVQPLLTRSGIYAARQRMPASDLNPLDTKVQECVALPLAQAGDCYDALQRMTYDNAVDIFLVQARQFDYVNAEVQGYTTDTLDFGPTYYNLARVSLPPATTVPAGQGININFYPPSTGTTSVLGIDAGALAQDTTIFINPSPVLNTPPPRFNPQTSLVFEVTAFNPDGSPSSGFPSTLTLTYTPQTIQGYSESSLRLLRWNGTAWVNAACGQVWLADVTDMLTVQVCTLGKFALTASPNIYLPLARFN